MSSESGGIPSEGMELIKANVPSMVCVVGAVVLLALGIDQGWGWLIFLAFCLGHGKKSDDHE